jgi:adenosylhomocysteine nucleosidase
MRVLVTFALDAEFAPWRKRRRFNRIDYRGLQLWRATDGEFEITIMRTGVGDESASKAMDLMLQMADNEKYFDICISSGLAGALHESLKPGDIIAPRMIQASFRSSGMPLDSLAVDEELHQRALRGGAKRTECLFTTDMVLLTAKQKAACSSKAQSVDMESFEIVKEARAWGARCVVLRAISDSSNEELPINFNLTLSRKSQISISKVILQLIKNPRALPALLRFGRQSRLAAQELANFLESYIPSLKDLTFGASASTVAGL